MALALCQAMARTKRTTKESGSRRSPKAPSPAREITTVKAQATRRQRSATAAVRKDTTLLQTDEGPRVAWSAAKPMFPKR
jgi:hypothetical protein